MIVKFMLSYPVPGGPGSEEWVDPANIAAVARAVEDAGLDAIGFTDHPAPSLKWLEHGGHGTFDPFVALGFCAAVTRRIRLMTHVVVLPYRNPLLTAKAMTSVDVLSGGRATFVLGTGYLRSEFAALGVDFDQRNVLFDEAVGVIRDVWTSESVSVRGSNFVAAGQAIRPRAVQQPHPPLWLGGNSTIVLERVARYGRGWAPLQDSAAVTRTARTRNIGSLGELARLIRSLGERLDATGRSRSEVDIMAGNAAADLTTSASPAQRLDGLAALAEIGVTHAPLRVPRGTVGAAIAAISSFGEQVLSQL